MNMSQINLSGLAANAGSMTANKEEQIITPVAAPVNEVEPKADTFEKETPALELGTYEKPRKLSADTVRQMKEQIYESMRALVEKTLGVQVGKSMSADEMADVLGLGKTPEEAAAAISEDGAWGVNAVATRLMDMALSLSGGDVSKAELLREAVQKGFEEVGVLEELPQVCQDTYAEVMKRFDYWIEHGSMEGYEMKKDPVIEAVAAVE